MKKIYMIPAIEAVMVKETVILAGSDITVNSVPITGDEPGFEVAAKEGNLDIGCLEVEE